MNVLDLFAEMDEKINGVLIELEVINGKLDRLLAVGSARQTENNVCIHGTYLSDMCRECNTWGEKELDQHSPTVKREVGQAINVGRRLSNDSKPPEVRIHSPGFEDYKPEIKEELETTEEVIMDLTGVQCVATTEKAILVTKKGYQKWIPISQLSENTKTIKKGDYLENIELTEGAKNWLPEKPWDEFEVFKD